MKRLEQSRELHERVVRFALDCLHDREGDDTFDVIAKDIAAFQNPTQSRLVPTVVDAFRATNVFAFEPQDAVAVFETSGTTSAESGRHFFRTTKTYERLCVLWGRRALVGPRASPMHVVALVPDPRPAQRSSLAFMCQRFMEAFDAPRALGPATPPRWLLTEDGVDLAALRRHVEDATAAGRPMLLLATSFSLVMLLDGLRGERLALPAGSVVMPTGGFKGRTREIAAEELMERIELSLGPESVVGEYGMTELASQLYEGTLAGGSLRAPRGVYLPPPWLRPLILDPSTLKPRDDDAPGLAAFIDLCNVDSALYVVTQDIACLQDGGLRLFGRRPRAPLRGCSLVAEAVLARQSPNDGRVRISPSTVADEGVDASALARVRRLVEAARRIKDAGDELGQRARRRLTETTGLSAEGIELGLTMSLETEPTQEELARLCSSLPRSSATWVVLSANVFVAAHRAIACALATSANVFVRPSRRDPVLAELLHEAAPDLFRLTADLEPRVGEHVHAYGSDETMALLESRFADGIVLFAHGSGLGAGLVFESGAEEHAAEGFATDAVLFEQRGCLSPRVIVVRRGCDTDVLVTALIEHLSEWARRVPPPQPTPDDAAESAWFRRLAHAVGELHQFDGASVLRLAEDKRLVLPPVGRNLVVVESADPVALLSTLQPSLTCVGVAGDADELSVVRSLLPGVRVTTPGRMQSPPFDGPVDLRVRAAAKNIAG